MKKLYILFLIPLIYHLILAFYFINKYIWTGNSINETQGLILFLGIFESLVVSIPYFINYFEE